MNKNKVKSIQRSPEDLAKTRKLIIIAALIAGLNTMSIVSYDRNEKRREEQRREYVNVYEVTNNQDYYTKKLWLEYLQDKKISNYTNKESLELMIDDCLIALDDKRYNNLNNSLRTEDKYENTVFSSLVNIENNEGYYVSITDIKSKNVEVPMGYQIDFTDSVNSEGKVYITDEHLLEILYSEEKDLTLTKEK